MAFRIGEDCINCDVCSYECPNEAVYMDERLGHWQIDPEKCRECEGVHPEPLCRSLCPMEGCIERAPETDPRRESSER